MHHAPYNDIAEWYENYLRENPLYHEVLLPSLLDLIGDVQRQRVCDFACGQGWVAREIARRGAQVTGIDLADHLLALARRYEEEEPLGIVYVQDDVRHASLLANDSFDGCVCVLALMDIDDLQAAFQTIRRVLKRSGWLVFAITHPCFELPHAQWITMDNGDTVRAVRGYFHEQFWMSEGGGIRSRVGSHHRMLSTYLNTLVAAKFSLERVIEPLATSERVKQVPGNREVPSLLLIRAHAL